MPEVFHSESSVAAPHRDTLSAPTSDPSNSTLRLSDTQATSGATEHTDAIQIPSGSSTIGNESSAAPSFYQKPTKDEALARPWKHYGYPALSTFMSSAYDAFVVRKFGVLGARVVLLMQYKISRLEEQLHHEDQLCRLASGKAESDNGTFEGDPSQKRVQLMEEITNALERYQKFLLDHSALKVRTLAGDQQINNVKYWLEHFNQPIFEKEADFISHHGDLFPIVEVPKTPLRRFIDKHGGAQWTKLRLFRVTKPQSHHYGKDDPESAEVQNIRYVRDRRVDKVLTFITLFLGLTMMIAPLWILQVVSSRKSQLWTRLLIITVFLVAFTTIASTITVARPFEVLAGTAAYGAVLMVYMQLGFVGGRQD